MHKRPRFAGLVIPSRSLARAHRRLAVGVLATACMAALSGCSGSDASGRIAHLQGAVTIGGQTLPAGADGGVTFRPIGEGQQAFARIVDGRYDSPHTPVGPVKAFFSISAPTGRMITSDRTGEAYPETESIVPAQHGAGMDLEVAGDNLNQDFDL